MIKNKKGQVWVETVIYTMIAFALIAAVLAFVKPEIDKLQDKAIIEQSITLMKSFDSTIKEIIQGGEGNKRILETTIKEGSLTIDSSNDKIIFEMESDYVYSEIGADINEGNLVIRTEEIGARNIVTISRVYEDYNITFNLQEQSKTLTKAGTSYKVSLTNEGKNGKWDVNIELI